MKKFLMLMLVACLGFFLNPNCKAETYFIADTHFGNENTMKKCRRPYKKVKDMDEAMMSSWNNIVKDDDDVYILGDVSWHNVTKTIKIITQLNGNKHLIVGNHDNKFLKNKEFRECFVEICDYKEVYLNKDESIVLCHYPIPCFKNHYYGWYHLYGHVHTGWEYNMMKHIKQEMTDLYNVPCRMYNVGCMVPYMNYTPLPLENIIEGAEKDVKILC